MKNKTVRKMVGLKHIAGKYGCRGGMMATCGALGALLTGMPQHAAAMNLYDGHMHGNQLEVNLNVALYYTGIIRTNNPSRFLATGFSANGTDVNANGNDGDLNLRHGLVSNEFEILPILDIKDGDYGAHFSGEAYINTTYLSTNQNNDPASNNAVTIAKNNDFTSATRNIEGLNAQMLDAFVYGTHRFGADDGQAVTLKIGRQTLLWGQSLYLSNNGIAAGMAPFDVITADNNPNAQTQQIILPVGQVVATYQPNSVWTFQGYYQFQWQPDNLEAAGAFFNSADILDRGGQSLWLVPGYRIYRKDNINPTAGDAQFGLSTQLSLGDGDYDIGFYALRYNSKAPTVYLAPGYANYRLVYPRDIWIEGTSFSTTLFNANVAGEMSFRQHMNLATGANVSASNNANGNPDYPVGSTWAGQVSAVYVTAGVPLDPGGITLTGEIGFNHLLAVTQNKAALTGPANGGLPRTATAADMEAVVTPNYYDVLPNLSLGFPIGLTYNLAGRSSVDATENHGTGAFTMGMTATYKVVWVGSVTFYDHIGAPNPLLAGEPSVADRNYVMFNLQRTF